jgi:hypothetical protein
MKISNANFTYELPHQHVTDTALPPLLSQSKGKVSIMIYSLHIERSLLVLPLPSVMIEHTALLLCMWNIPSSVLDL